MSSCISNKQEFDDDDDELYYVHFFLYDLWAMAGSVSRDVMFKSVVLNLWSAVICLMVRKQGLTFI